MVSNRCNDVNDHIAGGFCITVIDDEFMPMLSYHRTVWVITPYCYRMHNRLCTSFDIIDYRNHQLITVIDDEFMPMLFITGVVKNGCDFTLC